MNIRQAKKEAATFGFDYFYEDLHRFGLERIINRIRWNISGISRLEKLDYWEVPRDALYALLKELGEEELDSILVQDYGLRPEDVAAGRAFFQRLADVLDEAIREVKAKLSE